MNQPNLLSSTILLALLSSTPASQANRILATHAPGGTIVASGFGSVIAAIGDVNGNGTQDYAVGAPLHVGTGTTPAGRVEAFDGSGALLWTRSGAGSDRLGSALTSFHDLTGDNIPEVLATAPGAAVDLQLLNGATGASVTIASTLPAPVLAMAPFPGDMDFFAPDGLRDIALLSGGSALMLSTSLTGSTSLTFFGFPIPSLPQETVISPAGGFFGVSELCVALGAPSLNQVRVVDLLTGQQKIFDGNTLGVPNLGTTLAFDPQTKRVIAGAPGAFNGAGCLVAIHPTSFFLLSVGGISVFQLGNSVTTGDIDRDGLTDVLGGGAGSLRILLGDGSTQTVFGSQTGGASFTFGAGVAVVGDTDGDSINDFVVGNTAAPGIVDQFRGGPSWTMNQNFQPGCTSTAFLPSITIPSVPALTPGQPLNIRIANGFLSLCLLRVGTPSSNGLVIPGSSTCFDWLSNPLDLALLGTDVAGNANFLSTTVASSSLLGLSLGFQEFVLYAGVAEVATSNTVVTRVGW